MPFPVAARSKVFGRLVAGVAGSNRRLQSSGILRRVLTERDYGLDDRAIGVRSPAGAKDFSSIHCVQTGSGAYPASCPRGTGGSFLRG
jgi:hypothetical protein